MGKKYGILHASPIFHRRMPIRYQSHEFPCKELRLILLSSVHCTVHCMYVALWLYVAQCMGERGSLGIFPKFWMSFKLVSAPLSFPTYSLRMEQGTIVKRKASTRKCQIVLKHAFNSGNFYLTFHRRKRRRNELWSE